MADFGGADAEAFRAEVRDWLAMNLAMDRASRAGNSNC